VRASVGCKSFCVDLNALMKRHGVFAVNCKEGSAKRENRTESEMESSEKRRFVYVSISVVAASTVSTQLPPEMGLTVPRIWIASCFGLLRMILLQRQSPGTSCLQL
jgi:hypothetical protein